METTKHTPEPWALVPRFTNRNDDPYIRTNHAGMNHVVATLTRLVDDDLADTPRAEANGARIVACVNACAGIDDPMELRKQRDYLMALVNELGETAVYWSEYTVPIGIVDRIRAAAKEVKP